MKVKIYKLKSDVDDNRELVLPFEFENSKIIDKYIYYGVVNIIKNTPPNPQHVFCKINDNNKIVFINKGNPLYLASELLKDYALKIFNSLDELKSSDTYKCFVKTHLDNMVKHGWVESYTNDDMIFSFSNAYEFILSVILIEEDILTEECMMPKISFDEVISLIVKDDINVTNNILLRKEEVKDKFNDDLILSNFKEGETIIIIEK